MNFRQAALTIGLGVGAILLAVSPVRGQVRDQGNCADRSQVVQRLADEYGETRQAIALTFSRQVIEFFASRDTGSWTLTITFPSGETCLLGAGDLFELTPTALTPGDPA